jgi:hypothetical protein
MNIVIDLETCPAQDPSVLEALRESASSNFKAPSSLTKEQAAIDLGITDKETIKFTSKDSMLAMWSEKFKVEAAEQSAQAEWRKTAFDGAVGHICVIGVAFDDEPPIALYYEDWHEKEAWLLQDFSAMVESRCIADGYLQPTFIGHNLVDFDLRFLFQRSVVLNVKPSSFIPFTAKPWDQAVYDTMTRWSSKDRTNMPKICKALGIDGKGDMDGSKVWDAVRDGKIADVAEYCKGDIERTRAMYRRFNFIEQAAA